MLADALRTGSEFNASDANTINGQPGDLFPCSRDGTFKLPVEDGKTYMLRLINAVFTYESFFSVAGHSLTVIGTDGSYVKPFAVDYVFIAPGQTVTALLTADRASRGLRNARYYMAARPLLPNNPFISFDKYDNSVATAVLEYADDDAAAAAAPDPEFPVLPAINDSAAADAYTTRLRSLASEEHPVSVPRHVQEHMLVTLAVNLIACSPDEHCQGPQGNRMGASLNNVSFEAPRHASILDAYYHKDKVRGVHTTDDLFPSNPPLLFNFTAGDDLPQELWFTKRGAKVKVLEYGSTVEVVLQNTALLGGDSHPIHLHGFSFYVVGTGSGNFDRDRDPAGYNLVDPPYQNTVAVPNGGWSAIRFRAENPGAYVRVAVFVFCCVSMQVSVTGSRFLMIMAIVAFLLGVWFMHCHFERHMAWGMDTVFIVKDGNVPEAKMLPPPPGMPRC